MISGLNDDGSIAIAAANGGVTRPFGVDARRKWAKTDPEQRAAALGSTAQLLGDRLGARLVAQRGHLHGVGPTIW